MSQQLLEVPPPPPARPALAATERAALGEFRMARTRRAKIDALTRAAHALAAEDARRLAEVRR